MPFEKGRSPLVLDLLYLLCRRFFGLDLLKGRSPLAFGLHLLCLLVPKVFLFVPFERLKPLGVYLASTYCAFGCRRFFWFGPFNRLKPLGLCLDKYAKFADSAYFANLLF